MRLVARPDPASSRRLPPPLLVAVRQQWVLAVLKYHGQWRRLSYLKRCRLVCYFRAQVIALRRPTTVRAVLAARQQWFVMDLKNWLASSTPTQDLLRRMLALPSCWAHSGTVAITLALHELDGFERLPQRACWLQRLWWLQRLHGEARGPSAKPQGCVPACPRDDHTEGRKTRKTGRRFPGAEWQQFRRACTRNHKVSSDGPAPLGQLKYCLARLGQVNPPRAPNHSLKLSTDGSAPTSVNASQISFIFFAQDRDR